MPKIYNNKKNPAHLSHQPHVMAQDQLVTLDPAPAPKYKRQEVHFEHKFNFGFQVGVEKEVSDRCGRHCIISDLHNPCSSHRKSGGDLGLDSTAISVHESKINLIF